MSPVVVGRRWARARESGVMSVAAGVAGLLAGAAAGPLADRLATNASSGRGLLARAPRSRWLLLETAVTALLGAACGSVFGLTLEAAGAGLFCFVLVVVTRTDLERRIIPNRIVVPGAVAMLVLRTVDDPSLVWLVSALAAGGLLLIAALVYPPGMGMGDVKLAAFLGAGLGAAVAVALFVGFLAALVPSAVLLARYGRAARKKAIPLGPFLALGGVVALFAGEAVVDWYLEAI
jgi:leader peptidase (prepilin peptidase)/N-methyltransferase